MNQIMNQKFFSIKNGQAHSNTGHVMVIFSPELELRPVLFAVYSGYQPDRGTFQGALPGDIVACCTWNRYDAEYSIRTVEPNGSAFGDKLPFGKAAEIWSSLKAKFAWLDGFTEPCGRSGVWLPVPEAEYLSVKAKAARIDRFRDRFGLQNSVCDFDRDRKEDLRFSPKPLDFNPDEYLPRERTWTGSLVSIDEGETWFGSNGNGKPAVTLETEPAFEHGSNYAHTETSRGEGKPGIKGWRQWKFLIRVCHGVHCRNHSSYGHTVDVWEVKQK